MTTVRKDDDDNDPAITYIDLTELPKAPPEPVADVSLVTLHRHILNCLEDAQRLLLSFDSLAPLVQYLLTELPVGFATEGAELRLLDPEGHIASLLPARHRHREELGLLKDSYSLYDLFDDTPEVTLLDLEDPRMFRVLRAAPSALGAVVMPLWDGSRLLGSYHVALVDGMQDYSRDDLRLFALLAQLIASSLLRVQAQQRSEQLALLDSVTETGNTRALQRELAREIARAGRTETPLALQLICIDDLDEIGRSRGELAINLVMRNVAERLQQELRSTDVMTRTSNSRFTVLLPDCGEPQAHDIAERLRQQVAANPIDDGRGAVIEIALSAGLVCWDPTAYQLDSPERLAEQMLSSASAGLAKVLRAGGNAVSVSRLGLLMV
ncbi:MAG: GGDEF domain-containing protein [Pseudomonadota bacterium]